MSSPCFSCRVLYPGIPGAFETGRRTPEGELPAGGDVSQHSVHTGWVWVLLMVVLSCGCQTAQMFPCSLLEEVVPSEAEVTNVS